MNKLSFIKTHIMSSDSEIDYDDEQLDDYSDISENENMTYNVPNIKSPSNIDSSSVNGGVIMTTEGIDESVLKTINLTQIQDIVQCHCCAKYFNKSLIVSDPMMGEQMCKHCMCWLNYEPEKRMEFDMKCVGLSGFCIAEYILTCYEAHDSTKCTRMTDHGGCFLCDYNLNLDIPNILNREMLPKFAVKQQTETKQEEKKIPKKMIVDNDIILKNIEDFKSEKLII